MRGGMQWGVGIAPARLSPCGLISKTVRYFFVADETPSSSRSLFGGGSLPYPKLFPVDLSAADFYGVFGYLYSYYTLFGLQNPLSYLPGCRGKRHRGSSALTRKNEFETILATFKADCQLGMRNLFVSPWNISLGGFF